MNWWLIPQHGLEPSTYLFPVLKITTAFLLMNRNELQIVSSTTAFVQHLPCARHCDRCFTHVSSFNSTSVFISVSAMNP